MNLSAGTGVRDISPAKPTFLAGYPHKERTSTGINDPLFASALCLQNEEARLILVAVDILQIDPQTARELRETISRHTALSESHVFISCTHTHSGPVTMDMMAWQDDHVVPEADAEYMEYFKRNVVEAALEAADSVKPAEIAWTTAQADGVGGNRLFPDGVTDPEVGILLVRDAHQGELMALSTIYSMHPTVLHENSTLVSSDFPGYTRMHLHEALGDELTVLYHTGPSGDQSTRHNVRSQTLEEAERLGRILGKAILKSARSFPNADFTRDVLLKGELVTVNLPSRLMPSLSEAKERLKQRIADYERLKSDGARSGVIRIAECAVFGAEETIVLSKCQESGELSRLIQAYMPTEVQVLRVGNCFLAGLPGEVFVEYSLRIKAQAPYRTYVVGLVNGDLQGYIVTPEAVVSGSYEANNSLLKPVSGIILADAALTLISQMC